jgi:hypothetical protein
MADQEFDARRLMGRIWRNYVVSGKFTVEDVAREWKTTDAEVRDAIRAARHSTKTVN